MWGCGPLRAAVPHSQKQVDRACNDGTSHIKLDIDASAVNGNKLMSHPRFYGGLLLTSVACGSAQLLNYLLCPLCSLHWLCFLTREIKKRVYGDAVTDMHWKENGKDEKMKKNLAMGRKKSVGIKQIRMCHEGQIKLKKNCKSRQSSYCSASLVMASLWGDGGRMQIKGEEPGDRPVAPQSSEETSFWELLCS